MAAGTRPIVTLETPDKALELAADPRVLALVRFGVARAAGDGRSPWIDTGLQPPGDGRAAVQCWRVGAPVTHTRQGRFTIRAGAGLALLATAMPAEGDPAAAAQALYRDLFAATEALGFPHLLRIWQYLPRIHESSAGETRYQRFCAGRRAALQAAGRPERTLPAATLVGDDGASLLLYALAAAAPGTQIENPRQVSAFRYPPRYGRAAPSFSRALAQRWSGDAIQIYISGTASVVGHASVHVDALHQLEETLRNLEALLAAARVLDGVHARALSDIAPLTAYLRRAGDYPLVRDALAQRLPQGHPVMYLRADVCRPELLVEIEGLTAASPPAARPARMGATAGVVQW